MRVASDPPIRVGHIVDCFGAGGIATGVCALARSTSDRVGHAIISLRDDFRLLDRLPPGTDAFVVEPGPTKLVGFSLRLAALVRRERIDVIHCNNQFAWLDSSLASRLTGRPCLQTFHGVEKPVEELPSAVHRKCRIAARLGSRVTAVGDASRRMVCALSGIPEEDVEVIPNGVDLARFRPARGPGDPRRAALRAALGVAPDAPLVVHAAGLRPVKDQATLIRAWRVVADHHAARRSGPDPLLLMVGEGECRDDLASLADGLGIAGSVLFLGHRPDLDDLLPAGDLFVLSSISEGLSFAVLEAMACGLPVVATDVGGNRELVADGATGLLVPPRDPLSLASALGRLLAEPGLGLAMGARGRTEVERSYDLAAAARRYVELYESLAGAAVPAAV